MKRLVQLTAILAALFLVVPAGTSLIGRAIAAEPGAPTGVRTFPVRGGIGIIWSAPEQAPAEYQVERRRPSGNWAAESGKLAATVTHWTDPNVQPDATVEYRVLALYDDARILPSDPVTAHRPAEDPVVGDVDVLMIDTDPAIDNWLQPETASPVQQARHVDGGIELSAGTIKVTIPTALPGPGRYPLGTRGYASRLTQGEQSCQPLGQLWVDEVAYTASLEVATFAGYYVGSTCNDADDVRVEIRVHSAKTYSAVAISPANLDYGRLMRGTPSETKTVVMKNTGTETLRIHEFRWDCCMDGAHIAQNTCPSTLAIGAECSFGVMVQSYGTTGPDAGTLHIYTSARRYHGVALSATIVSLPTAPHNLQDISPYSGVALRWGVSGSNGGTPIRGYFIYRYLDGTVTKFWVPTEGRIQPFFWEDPKPPAGATYAVSTVNEIGESAVSETKISPTPGRWQLTAPVGKDGGPFRLGAITHSRYLPLPVDDAAGTGASVAAAPGGRQIAYTLAAAAGSTELLVRTVEPGQVGAPRVVATAADISDPSWSPDGTRIAYTTRDAQDRPCVDIVAASGEQPIRVGCNLSDPTWSPDARSLVVDDHQSADAPLARVDARATGTRLSTIPGTAGGSAPVVSPDGHWIAYRLRSDSGTHAVAVVAIAGGTPKQVTVDGEVASLAWGPDIPGLYIHKRAADHDAIAVAWLAADGSISTPFTTYRTAAGDRLADMAWQGIGAVIAPTPTVLGPAVSIPFRTERLLADTLVTCRLDDGSPERCTSPFRATGLSTGQHTLRVSTDEPDGAAVVAARTFTVDATAPVARITTPTYATSLAPSATIGLAATDSTGVATYDVRFRKAHFTGTFGAYSQPWTGTRATSVSLSIAAGYEYCFSTRARDVFGNLGAWSADRCFSRPMDDRWLTAASAGWTRASWSAFYLGTATHTGAYGASLTRTVQGKRFALVATRCPTCGVASVYLNGRYITAVNLYSSTTQRQAVIPLPTQAAVFNGTLKVTTRSTNKLVQIDGLAVRRT